MSLLTTGLFLLGLVLLILGSEWLVKAASRLAVAVGVPPVVVGLTVVSLGTTSPEVAVSLQSAWSGQSEMAVGNCVGSCILNLLLILGLSALILPLEVPQKIIRFDVPLTIGVNLLLWLLARDGLLSRWEGMLLASGAVGYTIFCIVQARRESFGVKKEYAEEYSRPTPGHTPTGLLFVLTQLGIILVGIALLVLGSRWMVNGAVEFARFLKLSELIISLTVIAVGTSLPEIATTITATLKGNRDIAVGNVIGANLLNILSVLGVTATLAPQGIVVPLESRTFDIPVMLAVSIACLPVFFNRGRIERWEGGLFVTYYVAYVVYLILMGTGNMGLPVYRTALLFFAIPLTSMAVIGVTTRNLWRAKQATKENHSTP